MSRAFRSTRCGFMSLLVLALLLSSCGDGSASEPDIPEQPGDQVSVGADVYQAACASCHGTDLRGTDQGPSHLSVVYEPNHHSDAAFFLAVRNGTPQHHWRFGDMEPVDGLSDEDIVALTAFVREQQRVEGFEPYPP